MWSIAWWRLTVSSCSISLDNITRQRITLQYQLEHNDKYPSYQEKQWLVTNQTVVLSSVFMVLKSKENRESNSVWSTSCLNKAYQKFLLFFLYFPVHNSMWRQVESPFNLAWPHQLLEKTTHCLKRNHLLQYCACGLNSLWNSVWYWLAFVVCFHLKHRSSFMLFSMPK